MAEGDGVAGTTGGRGWLWDVVLSFAGAQRDYVGQVAAALEAQGVRCFYDADEQVGLWGKHLPEELPGIYGEQAGAVVVFVSAEYAARDWTRLERQAALDRAARERREYVLPARFDDTPLPGLLPGIVTVDLRTRTPQQFAGLIAAKLADLGITEPAGNQRDAHAGRPLGSVRVADADLRRLGVHAAISVPGIPDEVPPEYVPRDTDTDEHGVRAKIAAAARQGGFVLLTGGSSVGKTRCAAEAVKELLPDWWLIHPGNAADIEALAAVSPAWAVVWLDELQRYLDSEYGLAGVTIRALLDAPGPVVIIGTLWPDRYAAYTSVPVPGAPDTHAREREILDLAAVVRIRPQFTAAEQDRARDAAARDPRLAAAVKAEGYGLTQTLAAAPQLVARWEDAQETDPYAWAVLTAALDAARLGARAPLTAALLRAAAPGYCTSQQQADAPENWFEQALAYATTKLYGSAAALSAAGAGMGQVAGYLPADYLIQHASRERRAARVPASAWDAFLSHITDQGDTARLALSAAERALYRYAIPLYRRAADAGSSDAMFGLGYLVHSQGNADQAEWWYRKAAEAGHFGAMTNLAVLLRDQGRPEQAEHWLSKALEGGQIGYAPGPRDREPGDAEWLSQQAAGGDLAAMASLGDLLAEQGNADQAEQWYRQAAEAGYVGVMGRLADLLDRKGHPDLAEQWYRAAADTGDGGSVVNLGIFLARHGHPELAEQCYRKAAASGGPAAAGAMYNLGGLLQGQGDDEQAETWFRRSAAVGHSAAMASLGSLLGRHGDAEQAEQWYRRAIAAGNTAAKYELGKLGLMGHSKRDPQRPPKCP